MLLEILTPDLRKYPDQRKFSFGDIFSNINSSNNYEDEDRECRKSSPDDERMP